MLLSIPTASRRVCGCSIFLCNTTKPPQSAVLPRSFSFSISVSATAPNCANSLSSSLPFAASFAPHHQHQRRRFVPRANASTTSSVAAAPKYYSRFSANNIMTGTDTFRISDYDVVGFDLDNTLLRYKVSAMVQLEYDSLAKYMVEVKGFSPKHLMKPFVDDLDFLQKGLIVDLKRGNVLKVSADGFIRRAAHGTRFMEANEICAVYGSERKWDLVVEYTENMLLTWNGPYADAMRSLLDYFDMPASLVFARCVDTLDEARLPANDASYEIWKDILDGIYSLYSREHFQATDSPYFEELKSNVSKYVHKSDPILIEFLRRLKANKTTFLLTGSHVDFANLTATHALGADWKDLFDFVVCFARKPGFFIDSKPFCKLDGHVETGFVEAKDIELNKVYTQGNLTDLIQVLRNAPNAVLNPKILYVGDNLIQDVYTPKINQQCDSIAVAEEMLAEGIRDSDQSHEDESLLTSQLWGSYFGSACDPTLWSEVIRKNARLCVADVAILAHQPLDFEYKCFTDQVSCSNGFFPNEPTDFYKR